MGITKIIVSLYKYKKVARKLEDDNTFPILWISDNNRVFGDGNRVYTTVLKNLLSDYDNINKIILVGFEPNKTHQRVLNKLIKNRNINIVKVAGGEK